MKKSTKALENEFQRNVEAKKHEVDADMLLALDKENEEIKAELNRRKKDKS